MFNLLRKNDYRKSYKFINRSIKMKNLSDVTGNDLTPVPYDLLIQKDLKKIEREFSKKIKKCRQLELDTKNKSMFDADIENAESKLLGKLQGYMGIHNKMINEVILNTSRSKDINEETLNEKIKQKKEIDILLKEAEEKLIKRDIIVTGTSEYEVKKHE